MGFFKRKSLVFITTAFLLLTLVEALVYFKLMYFNPNDIEPYLCTAAMKTPSEILLGIAILGVLSGAVGTACLGLWRTIFWGLLFTFISNLFRLFYLWQTVAYWTPPQNIGVNPCPSDLPLLVTVNLS